MSKISNRLAFFAKIKQRSAELTKTAEEWAAIWAKEGKAEAGAINVHEDHKPFKEREPYTTDRYATDINYAVSQFPDKSAAVVNNDVTARAKKVSEGHFTGASHYLVNEVMIENAGARGYALMVTGWTGKGTLTKTVNGVVNEGPYAPGTQVVATFTPAAGYSFTSWGDGNTSNPRTFTMDSNIVTTIVTAAIPKYTLAFSATGDGSISATVGGQSVTTGTEVYVGSTVVLTATPNEGKTVDQWSGLPEGTVPVGNVATFTMPSAAVTASVSFKVAASYFKVTLTTLGEGEEPYTYLFKNEDTAGSLAGWTFEYSTNGSTWNEYTFTSEGTGAQIPLSAVGDYVYFRGTKSASCVCSDSDYINVDFNCPPTYENSRFSISGDITTLLTPNGGVLDLTSHGGYVFYDFASSNLLADVSGLELPSTTLTESCYEQMFQDCTSLTSVPSSITAQVLAESCCDSMFDGCTGITSIPSGFLPATSLAPHCYESMFEGCTSLTSVPSDLLPATTLAQSCYSYMFYGTALQESPILPAPTLVQECYYDMFFDCGSLTKVTCYATDISASDCTAYWLSYVAASGDFYWSTEEEPTTSPGWSRDASGIPSSWTPHPDIPAPAWNGLTFTSSGTVKMYLYEGEFCENENGDLDFIESTTNPLNCEYSIDGGQNWVTMPTTSASAVEIPSTEMWVRGNNPSGWSTLNSNTNSGRFVFSGSGSGSVTVSGSVMSLIDQTGTLTELPVNSGFAALFHNGTIASISAIKDASGLILPATRLYQFSYWGMFNTQECLIKAPSLPATILGSRCYEAMFKSCSSLAGPVNISATSPYYSGTSACSNMFASSATSSGAGGTIYVGGNVDNWNSSTAGIDSNYWTVQLQTEDEE